MQKFTTLRYVLLLLVTANALLLAAAGCQHASSPASAPAPAPESATAPPITSVAGTAGTMGPQDVLPRGGGPFVGSAACAECHAAEFRGHAHSRHAWSLRPMTREALGRLAPRPGPIPGTGLYLAETGGRYRMGLRAHPDYAVRLDYAFGSGKSGMTYVSVLPDGRLAQLRASYYPHHQNWYPTPGEENLAPEGLGDIQGPGTCFRCHAVMSATQTTVPAPRFFGIGCENCHGPGGAHVAHMRAHQYGQGKMEDLARWPAPRVLALCNQCHGIQHQGMDGLTVALHGGIVPTNQTNRFQPLGLAESRCFRESGGSLTCFTCHDPHANVSTDVKAYEAVCRSCHTTQASHRPAPLQTAAVKLCPVNPTSGCITCHMPSRPAMVGVPTMMADHFIRVFR